MLLWLGALALVLVPFFLPIPHRLQYNPVIGALGDRAHIVLLFLVTLLLARWRPLRAPLWRAVVVAAFIGGAIEGLQTLVGRSARWHDFQLDLIGIGLAWCWLEWRRRRAPLAAFGGAALVALTAWQLLYLPGLIAARFQIQRQFPELADFGHPQAPALWDEQQNAAVAFPDLGPPRGRVLRLAGAPPHDWPGAVMRHFPPDWTPYARLEFMARAVAPGSPPVRIGVRLDDFDSARHKAWAVYTVLATEDWQTYSLPLGATDAGRGRRPLRLQDMHSLLFFFPRPADSVAVEIDEVRLLRDDP
ncbi:MAG: hypothetical protein R6X25_13825 [Candidatus Krumholzibacteriia bacterium]